MSKVFAKYIVMGDSEDLAAFELAMKHVEWCQMNGSSRDIVLNVDGDGSANLRFFRDNEKEEMTNERIDKCQQLEFSHDIKKKMNNCEEIDFGTLGKVEKSGDGSYSIGE